MDESMILAKMQELMQQLHEVSLEIATLRRLLPVDVRPSGSWKKGKGKDRSGKDRSGKPKRSAQSQVREVPEIMSNILANYEITVGKHETEIFPNEKKDSYALETGAHYGILSHHYQEFLAQFSYGSMLELSMPEAGGEELRAWNGILTTLQELDGISGFHYDPERYTFQAQLNTHPKIIQLIEKEWFVRYVARVLYNAIKAENRQMTYLYFPELKLEAGDVVTVDLAMIIDSEFHWCICSPDATKIDLDEVVEFAHKLDTRPEQSHIMVLNLDAEVATALAEEYGVSVTNEEGILSAFGLGSIPVSRVIGAGARDEFPSNLNAFLNQHNLRPFPERREQVLRGLLKLIESQPQPSPLATYKKLLHQHLGISKTCIQDILNAVVRSGSILDEANQPLYSFNHPVGAFRHTTLEALQAQCKRSYCFVILKYYPFFFDFERNRRDFFDTVGLEPPPNDEIQVIRELATRPGAAADD